MAPRQVAEMIEIAAADSCRISGRSFGRGYTAFPALRFDCVPFTTLDRRRTRLRAHVEQVLINLRAVIESHWFLLAIRRRMQNGLSIGYIKMDAV